MSGNPAPGTSIDEFISAHHRSLSLWYTIKHSWKKKKRFMSIDPIHLTTHDTSTWENTNQWQWETGIADVSPSEKVANQLVIITKKDGKKKDTLNFESDHRAELLTDLQRSLTVVRAAEKQGKSVDQVNYRHLGRAGYVYEMSLRELATGLYKSYSAKKLKRNGTWLDVVLTVCSCSIEEQDSAAASNNTSAIKETKIRASYFFKDFSKIESLADNQNAYLFYLNGNDTDASDLFVINDPKFIENVIVFSKKYVGHEIKLLKSASPLADYPNHRIRRHGRDDEESLVSVIDFTVNKISNRHQTPVARLLTLSSAKLVERDIANYSIVTTRPYSSVACLVRFESDSQKLSIQYKDGLLKTYTSSARDALIASVIDFCRAAGNNNATVFTSQIVRGMKITPHHIQPSEDVQEQYIKLFEQKSFDFENLNISQITLSLDGFVSNIPYSGLSNSFAEKNGKVVLNCIQKVLSGVKISTNPDDKTDTELISVVLQMLRRVVATRVGFELFTHFPHCKIPLINLLKRSIQCVEDTIAYYGVELMIALTQPAFEGDYESGQCQLNKRELFMSVDLNKTIFELIQRHSSAGTGALVLNAAIELLTLLLCEPYSETTDAPIFNDLLSRVAGLGRDLFKLFMHPCPAISKNAGMLMMVVINEGDEEMAKQMQIIALVEGALLRHLHDALYLKVLPGVVSPTNIRNSTKKEMSKHLVGLWTAENTVCRQLLERVFPRGLVQFLDSNEEPPKQEAIKQQESAGPKAIKLGIFANWRMKKILKTRETMAKAVIRAKREQKPLKPLNWPMFFYQFSQDHRDANLIWNHTTREELRESMDNEMRLFQQEQDAAGREIVAWNDEDFEVLYPSLKKEISVGGYYISLLVDGTSKGIRLTNPGTFFSELWQNFLLNDSPDQKALCLRAMTLVFTHYNNHPTMVHPFSNLSHLIDLLENTFDVILRDRLLLFIRGLLQVKANAKLFIDNRGIYRLMELITLVHTHYTYGEEGRMLPEWYYAVEAAAPAAGDTTGATAATQATRVGPVSRSDLLELYNNKKINKNTRCWAQGSEKWKPLFTIPELRWTIMNGTTHGNVGGVLPKAELGSVILDILNALCSFRPTRHPATGAVVRPLPRVKRIICEPLNLPRIVQVILSGQDMLVEKTCTLLESILLDNAVFTSKFYLTGAFFFMMLYPNSNILPMVKLLQIIHNKQLFITEEANKHSVLFPLLPEALVCFLDNYTPENFASKFLSDNDDPETIWNSKMRKLMREKIELHLASLPQRLHSNTTTIYEYVPIPKIVYEELEGELFCHSFYLSRLCDTRRFPNWPIKQPLELFKSVLAVWAEESVKAPQKMSADEALEVLNLKPNKGTNGKAHNYKDDEIRKAYYKLAAKYHPDKNPDGREMFEKIQESYELLSTINNVDNERGSDKKISLLLLTQVILYTRFLEQFRPFKYPAYPQLWKLIQEQIANPKAYSNTNKTPLISPATHLLYLTVEASPLNSEEITRNNGVPIIGKCFDQAVSAVFENIEIPTLIIQTTPVSPTFSGKQIKGDIPDPKPVAGEVPPADKPATGEQSSEEKKSSAPSNALITIPTSKFNINDHSNQTDVPGEVTSSLLRTYGVMAKFPGSRKQLSANNDQFKISENICKCLYLSYTHPHIVTHALEAIYQFARQDDELQEAIINAGVVWHLLRLLFGYDHTLVNSGVEVNLESNRIMIANLHARMSIRALRRLSGIKSEEDIEGYSEPSDKPEEKEAKKVAAEAVQNNKGPIAMPVYDPNVLAITGPAAPAPTPAAAAPTPTPAPASPAPGTPTQATPSSPSTSSTLALPQKSIPKPTQFGAKKSAPAPNIQEFLDSPETEVNKKVRDTITAFLTPHIIIRLKMPIGTIPSKHYHKLLTELNTKHETAAFIWNNSTREDLMEFLNKKLEEVHHNPTAVNPYNINGFSYKSLANEIKVGGYYLRVYNASPTAPTNATTPISELFVHLVDFLASERNANEVPQRNPDKKLWDIYILKVSMALEALKNVIQHGKVSPTNFNSNNRIRLLFTFLRHEDNAKIQKLTLDVMTLVSSNMECISHIAAIGAEPDGNLMPYLLQLLTKPKKDTLDLVLKVIYLLVALSQNVIDAINYCGILYLLDVFANNQIQLENRVKSCAILGRMVIDKVHGPKVALLLSKFIPPVFTSTMGEDPQQTVMVFDADHENPELIWNNNTRGQFREIIGNLQKQYYAYLVSQGSLNHQWRIAEDFSISYEMGDNELFIGGVYISLFLKQPGWSLRNPRKFLLEVFDTLIKLAANDNGSDPKIQQLSLAIISLFQHHNVISDQLPSTGYIEKILPLLGHPAAQIRSLMVNIIHSMSDSQVCVDHLSKIGSLWSNMSRIITLPNDNLALTAECIGKILKLNRCEKTCLVEQASRSEFINSSLKLLERGKGVSPATQAIVVNYLKLFETDPLHGGQITAILDKSEIWSSYSSQSHDLFITGPATGPVGLLTAGSSTSVGLLTSTAFNPNTGGKRDEPPPLL